MAKNKVDPIPDEFKTFDELANFWESHDLADYEEQLQEVDCEIATEPERHFVLTLSNELAEAMQVAIRREGVDMQTLVNLWVQERLQNYRDAA